jgi:uncharacterized repeat protein (TIGR02543 family)
VRELPLVLVLSGILVGAARAEEPVYFPDARLKEAVEAELFISDPTPTDLLGLTELLIPAIWTKENTVADLTGLEYATNLSALDLKYHRATDLSPLSGLIHLRSLNLLGIGISDISPLSGLIELESLDLESNEITDILPLAGLTSLESLCLHRNSVSDISPLASLGSLTWLDLRVLPLNQAAYDTYIPWLKANNPGITLLYDQPITSYLLVILSTQGGSVVTPGEGTFTTAPGESVRLQAKADPGFVFVGWSGTHTATQNPWILTIDQDYNLQANFATVLNTIHVDDNGPGDPGPDDPAVSDPLENGTVEHPFDSIDEAIKIAASGATILVHAGTYHETIDFKGKQVVLTGFAPQDPNRAEWPVIDGDGSGPVVNLTHGEMPSCLLAGLIITGGKSQTAGAIRCDGSSPTFANCLIAGNRATNWDGAAILCTDSNATFVNCTIVDNHGGQFGAGLSVVDSQVTVVNSILWGNWPNEIQAEGDDLPFIRYSVVAGGWPGLGDLKTDPLFAGRGRWVDGSDPVATATPSDPAAIWVMGDYHLQSRAGRWDPKTATWVRDEQTSSCIDAGDPASPVGQEPFPNGGIINLGIYGGTAEAGKSGP